MSLVSRLRSGLASLVEKRPDRGPDKNSDGILVFANTGEVIRAESILKAGGLSVRVMGPPPALQTGCDMVIVCSLSRIFEAVKLLEQDGPAPLRMTTAGDELLAPVSLFSVKDYGDWLMVRAANMKITAEKKSRRIVNVSGGGCPDVPYLAALLIGQNAGESALIKKNGRTLCGYALQLALEELAGILDGSNGKHSL
jgi:hypothetical protein